jgi:hypothetical protein
MATWSEIEAVTQFIPSKKLGDNMLALEISIDNTDRAQQVVLTLERIEPTMTLLKVNSPLSMAQNLNVEAVVRSFGSLNVGSLSYIPFPDGDGMLCIGTTLPLDVFDLSQPEQFLLYLFTLGKTADSIRAQVS